MSGGTARGSPIRAQRAGGGGADGGVWIPQVADQRLDGLRRADPAQGPGRFLPHLVVGIVEPA